MDERPIDIGPPLEWLGYPTRSPYLWDNKREPPRVAPTPATEEILMEWDAVRQTIVIPLDETKKTKYTDN